MSTNTQPALNVSDLQTSLTALIQNTNSTSDDLNNLLNPAPVVINNPAFMDNVNQLISILLQSRDGKSQFSINDLTLLSQDPVAVTSLVSTVMLIVSSLPEVNLQFSGDAMISFVFKLLAYIFLVIVPQKANLNWTTDEKTAAINICMIIVQFLQSSQEMQNILQDIKNWLKSKGWCQCKCMSSSSATTVAQMKKNLPKAMAGIKRQMPSIKEKSSLHNKLDELMKEVKDLKLSLNK